MQVIDKPLTAADIRQTKHKIELALSALVLKQPFFAYLAFQYPTNVTEDKTPTAGADAKGRVYINPRFARDLSVQQMEFLLCHEVMHIAFLHCLKETMGSRDPRACNIAMDKVINETLIQEKVGTFIEGGQRHPGAHLMAWEDLYEEPECDDGSDDGDNDGEGGADGQPGPRGKGGKPKPEVGGIGDDILPCDDGEPTGEDMQRIKDTTRGHIAAAARAAKMRGNMPAGLARLIDEILYVKTPWHVIFERFMQSFVKDDYSWRKPNRRHAHSGLYLPSTNRVPRMGRMGIINDTSGSIGPRELNIAMAHINRVIETCMPEEVIVLHVDAVAHNHERFEPDDYPVTIKPQGGGGTDLRKGWEWFEQHEPDLDCILCITDCYTPWPEAVAIPSIVLSTTDKVAPPHVGETVRFHE